MTRLDRARRVARHPAFAAIVGLLALLLFCWPLVRVPRLSVSQAYVHLFGAWAIVIALIFLVARGPVAHEPEEVPPDDMDV